MNTVEPAHAAEAAKQALYHTMTIRRGPADAYRSGACSFDKKKQ